MLIQLYGNQVKFDNVSPETLKLVHRKLELCQVNHELLSYLVILN